MLETYINQKKLVAPTKAPDTHIHKTWEDISIRVAPKIQDQMYSFEKEIKTCLTDLANGEKTHKFEWLKGELRGLCSM